MTLVPPAGLPAPLEPLSELAVPISFSARIGGTSVAVDISFAGLAPGPVNVFQMDVRMPDSFAQGSPNILGCRVDYSYVDYEFSGLFQ